jgi:molecular chaperone DnaJ
MRADVTVEFEGAIKGVKVEIDLNKRVTCHTCRGTRAKPGSKPRKCFECGGRGSVIGNYGIKKRCPKCDGAGCISKTKCTDCEGIGV